ncbi:type III pantothenate kinase [Parvicella tangerina]|uniref:Type III pantothenate kinase n=1 Tax=Parvicella tangerina TaxID=2829795 RepID=A0A916JR22_9FLAO|nr:type III pantothenate kinase [Parvicella tangerina]CAG5087876.1 Type III pantothenate kinase [Parvicella tangerina]
MMHRIVDIGNTKIKMAWFENNQLVKVTISENEKEEIKRAIHSHQVDHTIISSVANEDLTKFVIAQTEHPIVLDQHTPLPIVNNYKTPETLGKDRLANAVGAYHLFNETNCLIIDAGTCLKFDVLNSSNEYIGGVISPGLNMRFEALHTFTDKLPLVKPDEIEPVSMGVDTLTSIHSGCYMGMNNEIESTIMHLEQRFENLKIIITGGDMEVLQNMEFSQKNSIFADRWLTLRGLNEILDHNVKS